MTWSALRRLLVPALLLIVAASLRAPAAALAPEYLRLLDWLPYLTLGAALVLCALFNRSRPFTAALGLAAVYWLIRSELQVSLEDTRAFLVYTGISIATPAAALVLLAVPERGLRNRYGALLAAMIPVLLACGWWLASTPEGAPAAALRAWLAVKPVQGYVLSLGASALFLAAGATATWLLIKRDSEDAAALITVLVFAFITLALFDRPKISAVMLGTAGLAIVASLVRSSHEMAFRDELTGLLGRRALNDRLKGLAGVYTIAMLDVDHFKQFNDTYGHDVGDDVLKMVARHVDRVGGGGTAYRYGGEEFCIVFPGRDRGACEPHLQALRQAVGEYRLTIRDPKARKAPPEVAKARRGRRRNPRGEKQVSVTVSIGVAEPDARHGTPAAVVKAADAALYRAKRKGRNRLSR